MILRVLHVFQTHLVRCASTYRPPLLILNLALRCRAFEYAPWGVPSHSPSLPSQIGFSHSTRVLRFQDRSSYLFINLFLYYSIVCVFKLCCVYKLEGAFKFLLVTLWLPVVAFRVVLYVFHFCFLNFILSFIYFWSRSIGYSPYSLMFQELCVYLVFMALIEFIYFLCLFYTQQVHERDPRFLRALRTVARKATSLFHAALAVLNVVEGPLAHIRLESGVETADYAEYEVKISNKQYKKINTQKNSKSNSQTRRKVQSSLDWVKSHGSAGTDLCDKIGYNSPFDELPAYIERLRSNGKQSKRVTKYSALQFARSLHEDYSALVELFGNSEDFNRITANTLIGTMDLASAFPHWAQNLKVVEIDRLLRSLDYHPLSEQTSNEYTIKRKEMVAFAVRYHLSSARNLLCAAALMRNLSDEGDAITNFDSGNRFPISGYVNFVADKDVNLRYEDVVLVQGECQFESDTNEFVKLFQFKCPKFSRAKLVGIMKSQLENGAHARDVINSVNSLFPDFQRLVEVKLNKKNRQHEFVCNYNTHGLWFVSLLPRACFYLHSENDFQNVENVFKKLVSKLRSKIGDFVSRYCMVYGMTSDQRKEYFAQQSIAFAETMRSSKYQVMFATGATKSEVVNRIITEERRNIVNSKNTRAAVYETRTETKRKNKENRNKIRKIKLEESGFYNDPSFEEVRTESIREYFENFRTNYGFDFWVTQYEISTQNFFTVNPLWALYSLIVFYIFVLIIEPLRTLFRWNNHVRTVETAIRNWLRNTVDVFTTGGDPVMVVHLLEIKTVCHIIYEWYFGAHANAMAWASNLAVTRGHAVFNLISNLQPNFTTESSFDSISSSLLSILSSNGIENLTDDDLKRFNAEMLYARNKQGQYKSRLDTAMIVIKAISILLFGFDPLNPTQAAFANACLRVVIEAKKYALAPPKTREEHTKLLKFYEENRDLDQDDKFNDLPQHLKSIFHRRFVELENLAITSRNILIGDTARPEPVVLMLCGKPKSGKTTAMNYIKSAVAGILNDGKIDQYVHIGSSQYFEGYRNQMFVSMDDQFICNDPDKTAEEINNFICMVNSAPYSLDMAFGDKGKVYFNSPFIFVTTNAIGSNKTLVANVADMDAFYRRVHILAERDDPISNNPLHDQFKILRCEEPKWVGQLVTSIELAALVLELHKRHERLFKANKELSPEQLAQMVNNVYLRHFEPLIGTETANAERFEPENQHVSTPPRPYASPQQFIRNYFLAISEGESWWKASWIQNIVYIFLALSTIGFAAYFIFGIKADDPIDPESHDERNNRYLKGKRRRKERIQKLRLAEVKFRRQSDHQIDGTKILEKSLVKFVARYGNEATSCVATHIGNGIFVYPYHWHLDFADSNDEWTDVEIFIVDGNGKRKIDYNVENIRAYSNLDLLSIYVPGIDNCLPKDATRFFMDQETSMSGELEAGAQVFVVTRRGSDALISEGHLLPASNQLRYASQGTPFRVEFPIEHSVETSPGDSGGMLFWKSPQGKNHIIGMHVGRSARNTGICIGLDLGMINTIKQSHGETKLESHICEISDFPLEVVEIVDKPVHLPRRSKFRPTFAHEYAGPANFIPAKLDYFLEGDTIIDPAIKAMSKLSKEHVTVCDFDRLAVAEMLGSFYPKNAKFARLLEWQETVDGVPELGYPGVDGTTSAGYPYCLKATKGKQPFITYDGDKHVISDDLMSEVIQKEQMMKDGINPKFIWVDILKDETRPVEKVRQGKTRLIATCPVDFLLLTRKYFGAFIAYLHTKCVDKPVSVGINVHSHEWTHLYLRFADKDPKFWTVLAGDFSNYDGNLAAVLGDFVVDFINSWYDDSEENKRVRKLIIFNVHDPIRLFIDIAYRVYGGNVSGNPITAEYNSLVQAVKWCITARQLGLSKCDIEMSLYGDDSIVALRKPGLTIAKLSEMFWNNFKMEYTHSSKKLFEGFDDISTVTYLGRRFIYHGKIEGSPLPIVRAPLDIVVIREILYYYKGNVANFFQNFSQSLRSFVIELSHHDRETYLSEIAKFEDFMMASASLTITEKEAFRTILRERTYDDWLRLRYVYDALDHMGRLKHSAHLHSCRNIMHDHLDGNFGEIYCESHKVDIVDETQNRCVEFYFPESTTPGAVTTDNSEYTDRASNDVAPTQDVELGKYHDAAPMVASAINSELLQDPYNNVNMEVFTLSEVMNREYPVASFSWTSGTIKNTLLHTVSLPDDIISQAFISDKIKGFKNFNAGVRISVRMSSSLFNYGRIMAFYRPDPSDDPYATARTQTIEQCSGYPHMLVSASSSEVAVLDIPFINNRRAIDRSAAFNADRMGQVQFRVLNPLCSANGGTASVTVFITAQFMDFKMYMPYQPNSSRHRVISSHTKQAQKKITSAEAIAKSEANNISGTLESLADIAGAVNNVPFLNTYSAIYSNTARLFAAGAKVLGLDKPTSLARTEINKVNPFGDVANSRGIDCSNKVAVDPENKISTLPNIAGVSQDEMALTYIAGTPMLVDEFTFDATTPIGHDTQICDTDIAHLPWTYAGWLANLTNHHSGSMKIKVYISASTLQAARVVFYVNTVAGKWQDCYHRVVDILGDTEVEMVLPYTSVEFARNNASFPDAAGDPPMYLYMQLLSYSPPQNAVNVPVYVNIYAAAASDFRLYGPLVRYVAIMNQSKVETYTPESNPRADFSKEFEPLHPSMCSFQHDGLIYGEEIRSYRDFAHRYVPVRAVSPGIDIPVWEGQGNCGPAGYVSLELLAMIFLYWRGSVRFKLLQQESGINCVVLTSGGGPTFPFAGTVLSSDVNPVIDFEAPFYHNRLFRNCLSNTTTTFTTSGKATSFMLKAGGDDFSFHFLVPPPSYQYPSGSSSYGVEGLRNWLTNSKP